MIARLSSLFLRTLREDPSDAEVPSHRLLVRAGYIRRAAPGIYTWLPLGLRVLRNVERIVREEMDAERLPGAAVPGAAAARALRGHRPLDRVRRQPLPAQGPQGRRLPARPDPRGDVHPRGQGPVLVVQGPAAHALPDPDQVPRRGAAARRPAARARVRHEGLATPSTSTTRVCSARTTRTAPPTSASSTGWASTTCPCRRCRAPWAAARARSSSRRAENGEDTYVRSPRRVRRERRGGRDGAAAGPRVGTTPRPRTSRTRPTRPTIDTLVSVAAQLFPAPPSGRPPTR